MPSCASREPYRTFEPRALARFLETDTRVCVGCGCSVLPRLGEVVASTVGGGVAAATVWLGCGSVLAGSVGVAVLLSVVGVVASAGSWVVLSVRASDLSIYAREHTRSNKMVFRVVFVWSLRVCLS